MIKKILIFTATYNEYPNIKILLDKINKLNLALDILIVDDYSNDGTLSFLKNYLLYSNNNLLGFSVEVCSRELTKLI